MAVEIKDVVKHSPAYKKGLKKGDILLSINGHQINDVLDFQFYSKNKNPVIGYKTAEGRLFLTRVYKSDDEDLGLLFETYLMDKHRRCENKCIFCFIDQLPKGMRESLYFKDDDSRLSFLFGNYITLTNLTEHEVERIIEMRISPVNISVHTMNPELRVKMMKNPRSGKVLQYIKRFSDAGIKINAQLVLCPEVNDGDELVFSLNELAKYYPQVQSISAVPVGLTKFREKLYPLRAFTKEEAAAVIDTVEEFNDRLISEGKERLAFAADEFYIKAEREIPKAEYYGEFHQLENGVGMWALFKSEFLEALENLETDSLPSPKKVSIATGVAAYPLIRELCDKAESRIKGLKADVFCVLNDFFGHTITVSGLVTGQDIIKQLKGKVTGTLLLPANMFKSKDELIFLDDVTKEELEKELGAEIKVIDNNGFDFLDALIN
ncbi:MAG: DUF512 domain-containing protein [Clostridiales bacterium]|jgi:putative radical SAM enzyme (TIGR03279 family)|nr:DUF512 domain-containing protein [Clostridiales bacterium]HOA33905.1 DUF512 domain-containing protein [Clostridiales bacterium]HOJ35508.1 DUF512 domain-containing protein [Clostridiales bacterium]HPP67631.1 DUF512 domain-containing protein [Clostridiales bacterium]HPU66748.1 DUF512 domain-containing protein [Clostridiales bacterium]